MQENNGLWQYVQTESEAAPLMNMLYVTTFFVANFAPTEGITL